MSTELRPLGVKCNILCQYCYQNPQRDAANVGKSYDIEKMLATVEETGGPFTLFGGEPLLLPKADLETIWAWGFGKYGRNSVQTNGTLISAVHIELFRKFEVRVGISLDGPGELNDLRWAGSLIATRKATARAEAAVAELCRLGMAPSIIVTLHRSNAAGDRLEALLNWIRYLDEIGVRSARIHLLEAETDLVRQRFGLTAAENLAALKALGKLERDLPALRFDLFRDIESLLLGRDEKVACVWRSCDPYTTEAVQGIEGNGERSNCGRVNKEGVGFTKAAKPGYERYITLHSAAFESGGCAGCRFFMMCKGQCPGTAIEGDWRNRTEHCQIWMELFRLAELELQERGEQPLSLSPERPEVEARLRNAWIQGRNPTLASILEKLRKEAL